MDDAVKAFQQSVNQDPAGALRRFQDLESQAHDAATATPTSPAPPAAVSTPLALGPQALATLVAQAVSQALHAQPTSAPMSHAPPASANPAVTSVRLSEKLPDIAEYDGDREKLDAWEQSLIQRMHANHDRYPTDTSKIAYAESRLTIGKRAHTLMSPYRIDGLCTLTLFPEWRSILRHNCGNPHEAEDARQYLRDLKQGDRTFNEYYLLFCAKKDRSRMDDASLVDCLTRGVNYATQVTALSWRTNSNTKPVTFSEYVQAFTEIDESIQRLQHLHPRSAGSSQPANKTKSSAIPFHSSSNSKATPIASAAPVTAVTSTVIEDPMDLSSAIIAVQGKPLATPGVKGICNKWKLCYYCKQYHPGKIAKECPNKKKPTHIRAADMEDLSSADGGVSVYSGKA